MLLSPLRTTEGYFHVMADPVSTWVKKVGTGLGVGLGVEGDVRLGVGIGVEGNVRLEVGLGVEGIVRRGPGKRTGSGFGSRSG